MATSPLTPVLRPATPIPPPQRERASSAAATAAAAALQTPTPPPSSPIGRAEVLSAAALPAGGAAAPATGLRVFLEPTSPVGYRTIRLSYTWGGILYDGVLQNVPASLTDQQATLIYLAGCKRAHTQAPTIYKPGQEIDLTFHPDSLKAQSGAASHTFQDTELCAAIKTPSLIQDAWFDADDLKATRALHAEREAAPVPPAHERANAAAARALPASTPTQPFQLPTQPSIVLEKIALAKDFADFLLEKWYKQLDRKKTWSQQELSDSLKAFLSAQSLDQYEMKGQQIDAVANEVAHQIAEAATARDAL